MIVTIIVIVVSPLADMTRQFGLGVRMLAFDIEGCRVTHNPQSKGGYATPR